MEAQNTCQRGGFMLLEGLRISPGFHKTSALLHCATRRIGSSSIVRSPVGMEQTSKASGNVRFKTDRSAQRGSEQWFMTRSRSLR